MQQDITIINFMILKYLILIVHTQDFTFYNNLGYIL